MKPAMIIEDSERIQNFVHKLIFGYNGLWTPGYAFGFVDPEYKRLQAGVVIHDYQPHFQSVEMSIGAVSKRWLTLSRMNIVADYVFNQLDCYTLVTRSSLSNVSIKRMWAAIGGQEILLPNLRGPGEHEVMHILTRDEAKQSRFWRP